MKQYIIFKEMVDVEDEEGNDVQINELTEFEYHPGISGQIELKKISESLTILRLYFRKLSALNKPVRIFDGSTEIMLTNYPVNFNSIQDLDEKVIEIKYGWTDGPLFTMLSLQDGEPTNNNSIHFKVNNDSSVTVEWTGTYTYYHNENGSSFKLNIVAYPAIDVITPLCSNDEELVEFFSNRRLEDFSKAPYLD